MPKSKFDKINKELEYAQRSNRRYNLKAKEDGKKETIMTSVRLPIRVRDILDDFCENRKRDRSSVIIDAILLYMEAAGSLEAKTLRKSITRNGKIEK